MDERVIVGGDRSLVTVRHVRASGTQQEIGRMLAAAAHEVHGRASEPMAVNPDVERVRRRWFELHHPALAARMRGIAEYFGIEPSDHSVALDRLGTFPRRLACTVGFYPGQAVTDDHPLLSRNMDFPTVSFSEFVGRPPLPGERAAVGDPWIVDLDPIGGLRSITVGFGDVAGGMDGVNEAGLAVALLADSVDAPSLEPGPLSRVGLGESQVVRYVLDNCATASEARDALRLAKHYYVAVPCHYVVADRSGDSFVWEHSLHRNHELVVEPTEGNGGRLVCTNHLLHRWPDATGLSDEGTPQGAAVRTFHRWRTLSAAMAAQPRSSHNDVRDQLAEVRVTAASEWSRTIWHAIYDLHEAAVEISFLLGDDEDGRGVYSDPVTLSTSRAQQAAST